MDPLTATAAAVSIVCGIVAAVDSAQSLYVRRKRRKAEEAALALAGTPHISNTNTIVIVDTGRPMDAFEFSVRMNYLLSRLGRQLLDEKARRQVFRLRTPLKNITSELRRLDSDRQDQNVEMLEGALARVNELKDKIEEVLLDFAARITAVSGLSEPSADLVPAENLLDFCYGAILCQTTTADARAIAVEGTHGERQQWGFVCRYCNLEVGDYGAVRFLRDGKAVVHSEMLAACHVTACASLANRRAYYKCLACYENRQDVNFSSASALEKHMEKHRGYRFVCKPVAETAVISSTDKNMSSYVLNPSDDMCRLMSDKEDGCHDAEATVSPPSSPEPTPRVVTNPPIAPAVPIRAPRPSPINSTSSSSTTTTTSSTSSKRAATPPPVSPVTPAPSPAIPAVPRSAPPPIPMKLPPTTTTTTTQPHPSTPEMPGSGSGHEYRPRTAELPTPAPTRAVELPAHAEKRSSSQRPATPRSAGPYQTTIPVAAGQGTTPPGSAGLQTAQAQTRHSGQSRGWARRDDRAQLQAQQQQQQTQQQRQQQEQQQQQQYQAAVAQKTAQQQYQAGAQNTGQQQYQAGAQNTGQGQQYQAGAQNTVQVQQHQAGAQNAGQGNTYHSPWSNWEGF